MCVAKRRARVELTFRLVNVCPRLGTPENVVDLLALQLCPLRHLRTFGTEHGVSHSSSEARPAQDEAEVSLNFGLTCFLMGNRYVHAWHAHI